MTPRQLLIAKHLPELLEQMYGAPEKVVQAHQRLVPHIAGVASHQALQLLRKKEAEQHPAIDGGTQALENRVSTPAMQAGINPPRISGQGLLGGVKAPSPGAQVNRFLAKMPQQPAGATKQKAAKLPT